MTWLFSLWSMLINNQLSLLNCTALLEVYLIFTFFVLSLGRLTILTTYYYYSLYTIRSDEGLALETSAFESLCGGQFTLSTQLIKPNYLVLLSPTQHHSFFRNLPTYIHQALWSDFDSCKILMFTPQVLLITKIHFNFMEESTCT